MASLVADSSNQRPNLVSRLGVRNDLSGQAFSFLPASALVLAALSTAIVALVPNTADPSMVPITVCGALGGAEVLRARSLKAPLFSPRVIVAMFALYFFYFVPVFHLAFGRWPLYAEPPESWQRALANWAWLHVVALGVYLFAVSLRAKSTPHRPLSNSKLPRVVGLAVLVGLASWMIGAARYGGPLEYLRLLVSGEADLAGQGLILIFAEGWPLVLLAGVLVLGQNTLRRRASLSVAVLSAFVVIQFLAAGLRGSRAATVWPFMLALTCYVLIVRPLSARALAMIGTLLVGFAWVYAVFKGAGGDILGVFSGITDLGTLSEETGRDTAQLLTEDFGRAGVQALLITRIDEGARLTFGESYLGNLFAFVPSPLDPGVFSSKTDLLTKVLYGQEPTAVDDFRSSRILGLGGEAYMNFGFSGLLLAFLIYGRLVAYWDAYYRNAAQTAQNDGAKLIAAVLPALSIILLISDSDNVILFCLKYALPLVAVALLSSDRDGRLRYRQIAES